MTSFSYLAPFLTFYPLHPGTGLFPLLRRGLAVVAAGQQIEEGREAEHDAHRGAHRLADGPGGVRARPRRPRRQVGEIEPEAGKEYLDRRQQEDRALRSRHDA